MCGTKQLTHATSLVPIGTVVGLSFAISQVSTSGSKEYVTGTQVPDSDAVVPGYPIPTRVLATTRVLPLDVPGYLLGLGGLHVPPSWAP